MDGSNEEEDEKTFDETENDHDIADDHVSDDHEHSITLESRSEAIARFTPFDVTLPACCLLRPHTD